jgi:aspartyl-tRNA(Asn)/glutamyl-tRNA(Gln) amidotransferase subunit A
MKLTDARAIAAGVASRRHSAREVTGASIKAAQAAASLNLFTELFESAALAAADDIDARIARGEVLPLAGVPVAVKDNLCTGPDLHEPGDGRGYGGRTTCASRMLETYRSPYTATTVQRLIDAGAVIIGKTNMDEFGMGSSTERSIFGPSRNPWDSARVCGGSSGGSAGAVAAGICALAMGSDTGGSIRQPASHCGAVGVKPTYGRASRYGLVAYASSLDQVGVLGASVSDAATALEVFCGADDHDLTVSSTQVPAWGIECEQAIDGLRLAVPRQARSPGNDARVTAIFEETVRALAKAGAVIVDVDLPSLDDAVAAYYIIAPAEASSNLARYDGIRYGRRAVSADGGIDSLYERSRSEALGEEVQRRIMLGTYVLSAGYYDAYYATALKVRRRILADFNRVLGGGCHAVLMPCAPGPAFGIGAKTDDALAMYLEDAYTVAVNLAGLPAACVPAGLAREGGIMLPVGVQFIGAAFDETSVLRAARQWELVRGELPVAAGAAST